MKTRLLVGLLPLVAFQASTLSAQSVAPFRLIPTALHPTDSNLIAVHAEEITAIGFITKNGSINVKAKIQQALDYMRDKGGGILYLPAGIYRCDSPLTIHEGVGLRGDWQAPAGTISPANRTIINIKGTAANGVGTTASSSAFIALKGSVSINGITFHHVDQLVSATPTLYPPTIHLSTNGALTKTCASITNVTLVNSYAGIVAGDPSNNIALPVFYNIHGSPLSTGITIDHCTDVHRIERINFNPDIWKNSGLSSNPNAGGAHATFMKASGSGLVMRWTDNGFIANTEISGYRNGVFFETSPTSPGRNMGGLIYGLDIDNCTNAILATDAHISGVNIAYSTLSGTAYAVRTEAVGTTDFTGRLQFFDTTLSSDGNMAVSLNQADANAQLSFQNCTFTKRVEANSGNLSLLDNQFPFPATSSMPHVKLLLDVTRANLLANTNGTTPIIVNTTVPAANTKIDNADDTYLASPPRMTDTMVFAPVVAANYYNPTATPYGGAGLATGNDSTNDAPAIQAALNAAAAAGGIVFLPPGRYTLDSGLTVPANVELRGSLDFPFHTRITLLNSTNIPRGTRLDITFGQGADTGTPALTLRSGSIVRGLALHYPDQTFNNGVVQLYPPAIKVTGADVTIRHVVAHNPYKYIDANLDTADNLKLDFVMGYALKQGVAIGRHADSARLHNIHLNPHFWVQSVAGTSSVPFPVGITTGLAFRDALAAYASNATTGSDAFWLGDTADIKGLGNFAMTFRYGVRQLVQTAPGGPSGTFAVFGIDGGGVALRHEGGDMKYVAGSLINLEGGDNIVISTPDNLSSGSTLIANLRVLGTSSTPIEHLSNASITVATASFWGDNPPTLYTKRGPLNLWNGAYRKPMTFPATGASVESAGSIFFQDYNPVTDPSYLTSIQNFR